MTYTLRNFAQDIKAVANGGVYNPHETVFDIGLACSMICSERDTLVSNEISNHEKRGEYPDEACYTSHILEPKWDEDRRVAYVTLPNGRPNDVSYGRGVTAHSVIVGGAEYACSPRDWVVYNQELRYAEGVFLFEIWGDTIRFSNMDRNMMPAKVEIRAIENGSRDPDQPLSVPERYKSIIMDRVLQRMGFRRDTNPNLDRP